METKQSKRQSAGMISQCISDAAYTGGKIDPDKIAAIAKRIEAKAKADPSRLWGDTTDGLLDIGKSMDQAE